MKNAPAQWHPCSTFGTPEKQILVEPVFAQFVQAAQGKILYGIDTLLSNPDSIATTAGRFG